MQHAGYDLDVPATTGIRLVSAHTFSRSDILRAGAGNQASGFEIQNDDTVDLELGCKCSVSNLTVCCKSAKPIHFRVWHPLMGESVQPGSLLTQLERKQHSLNASKHVDMNTTRRDASGRSPITASSKNLQQSCFRSFGAPNFLFLRFRDL